MGLELAAIVHVDVEGRLRRLRLGLAGDRDRRLVPEPPASLQPGAGARPEGAFQLRLIASAQLSQGADPHRLELDHGFRPDPGDQPRDSAAKRSRAASRESTTNPAGLPSSLVILASIRLSEMPTEQVSPVTSRISVAIRRIVAFGEKSPVRSR